MKKECEFENVIIGVSASGGQFLISGDDKLKELMDGEAFEDNAQSLDKYPTEPGVYRCTLEFWFERGTHEGWDAPGESEWDFVPVNIEEIHTGCIDTQWTKDWPQKEGFYWFYGWLWGHHKSCPAETDLVEVFQGRDSLVFVSSGNFIYKSEAIGIWQPAVVPGLTQFWEDALADMIASSDKA